MNIEITNETKNPLLGRKEAEFQLMGKVTPSRKELKSELAKALKAKEELIVVDMVDQKSGSNLTTGRAKVYEDEETMSKVELGYHEKRGVKGKKEEAPAAPAEAPKEEKPEEAPKGEAEDVSKTEMEEVEGALEEEVDEEVEEPEEEKEAEKAKEESE